MSNGGGGEEEGSKAEREGGRVHYNTNENVQFLMGVAQWILSCVHYKRSFIISRVHNNESLLYYIGSTIVYTCIR